MYVKWSNTVWTGLQLTENGVAARQVGSSTLWLPELVAQGTKAMSRAATSTTGV